MDVITYAFLLQFPPKNVPKYKDKTKWIFGCINYNLTFPLTHAFSLK